MEARFLGCAVATHWLPHTPVQIFFRLVLVYKRVSSLNIQTGIWAVTFCITLLLLILIHLLYIKRGKFSLLISTAGLQVVFRK